MAGVRRSTSSHPLVCRCGQHPSVSGCYGCSELASFQAVSGSGGASTKYSEPTCSTPLVVFTWSCRSCDLSG